MIPRRLIIEFIGIPGSSKTTIAQSLSQHLIESGLIVRLENNIFDWAPVSAGSNRESQTDKFIRNSAVAEAIRNPLLYFWMLAFAASIRPFNIKNIQYGFLILGWIRRTNRNLKERSSLKEINMQDEGAFHLLTRLAMQGNHHSTVVLKRVAARVALQMPRILVFINPGPIEAIVKRQARRQGHAESGPYRIQRGREMGLSEAVELRQKHQDAIEAISKVVTTMAGEVVVWCDGNGTSIENNVRKILDAWQAC